MTWRRSSIAALGAALIAAGAACSSPEAIPEPRPDPTTASSRSTSPPPSTPEEEAAQAALIAFEGSFDVGEELRQAPASRNWEPEIREYSTDPVAGLEIQTITDMAELGIRQQGASTVEPQVTGVDLQAEVGPMVSIKACYDNSTSELVFAETGVPIKPPDGPDELQRYWWLVTVVQAPGQPWLVNVVEPQIDSAC